MHQPLQSNYFLLHLSGHFQTKICAFSYTRSSVNTTCSLCSKGQFLSELPCIPVFNCESLNSVYHSTNICWNLLCARCNIRLKQNNENPNNVTIFIELSIWPNFFGNCNVFNSLEFTHQGTDLRIIHYLHNNMAQANATIWKFLQKDGPCRSRS